MLFHSTYSNTNGPIRIFDEDPCIVCTKVSDKFVEVLFGFASRKVLIFYEFIGL
jgi:hypothetical protein